MPTEERDLSVIIVSWNVRDFLRKCLASVYRFTEGVTFEVFVVDNHSADGSAEMVRSEFPQVRLIENAENRGFARANNQAIREASGRFVLLLNPDTELIDNAFKKMAAFMDGHDAASALAPRLIYADGTVQPSCRSFPTLFIDLVESLYLDQLFPRSPFFNRYRLGGWGCAGTREVDQPYGACLLVRRSSIDEVGLLDEGLFMYYDEIDLCFRLKRKGGKVYFTDTATVIHHANKSSAQAAAQCEQYKHASRLKFFATHYGAWSVGMMTVFLVLRTAVVWGGFGLCHLLTGRPRDLAYFKQPVSVMWTEQLRFFCEHANASKSPGAAQ